jgi:hypothetical protein
MDFICTRNGRTVVRHAPRDLLSQMAADMTALRFCRVRHEIADTNARRFAIFVSAFVVARSMAFR